MMRLIYLDECFFVYFENEIVRIYLMNSFHYIAGH